MEAVAACAACGGREFKKLFSAVDPAGDPGEEFTLVACAACGLAFVSPRPSEDELGRYYPGEYYGEKNVKFNPLFEFFIRRFRSGRVRDILGYRKTGAALDIGCARGRVLSLLKQRGWEVMGTELSEGSAAFARDALGITVFTGGVEGLPVSDERFDVVTMWHVFEHLPRPGAALRKIHGIIKRDGVLIIAVPNFASLQSRISGNRWFHLDVPRHLFHYTPETLTGMLEKNGFEVVKIKYSSFEYNYFGMVQSLYNMMGARTNYLYDMIRQRGARLGKGGGQGWDFFLTVLLAPVVFPVGFLASFAADFTRYGGTVEVHARKKRP